MVSRAREALLVLLGAVVVIALALASYHALASTSRDALDLSRMHIVEAILMVSLLCFLAVVTLRHLALVLWSFFEHVDQHNDDRAMLARVAARSDADLPLVSIVVPAFNEAKVIRSSLESLLALDYPAYEVIVVDDGSTDDTYAIARAVADHALRGNFRVLSKPNGGKADALNYAISLARGSLILAMDSDTRLDTAALRRCEPYFVDPRIGAVAGCVRVINRENALTWLQAFEFIQGLALVRMGQSFLRLVTVVPGPLGMFRKSALVQLGAYDSDTFAEDTDLTLKLLVNSWHISYEPRAIAWSESPSRLLDLLKQRYRWTRGVLQALAKQRPWMRTPRTSPVNFFVLWYAMFEATAWPIANTVAHAFFVYIGLKYGVSVYILYWWAQLFVLDIVTGVYAVVLEREDPRMLVVTPLVRICYSLLVDVAKMLATIEQWFGLRMNWGKLEREGKL